MGPGTGRPAETALCCRPAWPHTPAGEDIGDMCHALTSGLASSCQVTRVSKLDIFQ